MTNGGAFGAKKFFTGTNPNDYLSVTLTGYTDPNGAGSVTGTTTYFLADYTPSQYISSSWDLVDLSPLNDARSIVFSMNCSDTGVFGINTPTYFALDQLTYVPEPSCLSILALGSLALLHRKRTR